jgi:peptidyl-prolyl cis-trans isomerase A (cyclophilin A)
VVTSAPVRDKIAEAMGITTGVASSATGSAENTPAPAPLVSSSLSKTASGPDAVTNALDALNAKAATLPKDSEQPKQESPTPSPQPGSSSTEDVAIDEAVRKVSRHTDDGIRVRFETTKGLVQVVVKPDWAPAGAAQFLSLVSAGFYTNVAIFRVLTGFCAQFGISGDPDTHKQYADHAIDDDPNVGQSNRLGTITFASHGPNTRSTQLFFNTMDNARLDSMGFTPFGYVEKHDLRVITSFYGGYGETIDQGKLVTEGNAFLKQNYPKLDYVLSADIV